MDKFLKIDNRGVWNKDHTGWQIVGKLISVPPLLIRYKRVFVQPALLIRYKRVATLNLSKVFNKVPNDKLLHKLDNNRYGVIGRTHSRRG